MLEHIPQWLGHALRNVRAGHAKLISARLDALSPLTTFTLSSPAFASGTALPPRFTADGEGISPPLHWAGQPEATRAFALIVEDPDAPAPQPLVHAIVWGIDGATTALSEGAIARDGAGDPTSGDTGRNSALIEGWLPPDPPTGHGAHDYVFQLFALREHAVLGPSPGRGAVEAAIVQTAIAVAVLVGTYQRGAAATVNLGNAGLSPA